MQVLHFILDLQQESSAKMTNQRVSYAFTSSPVKSLIYLTFAGSKSLLRLTRHEISPHVTFSHLHLLCTSHVITKTIKLRKQLFASRRIR